MATTLPPLPNACPNSWKLPINHNPLLDSEEVTALMAGDALACADTANNRVLFWHGLPDENASCRPADYVIEQYNFEDNGENRWEAVTRDTMGWPYGIWMHNGRIAITDSGNSRVIIWKQMT